MEDLDFDVPEVLSGPAGITMDLMFQYLIERNDRHDELIKDAMKIKAFRKATLKWIDSLGDITIKKTHSTVCSFSGGFKYKEQTDEDDVMNFTDYLKDNELTRWITEY